MRKHYRSSKEVLYSQNAQYLLACGMLSYESVPLAEQLRCALTLSSEEVSRGTPLRERSSQVDCAYFRGLGVRLTCVLCGQCCLLLALRAFWKMMWAKMFFEPKR